MADDRPDLFRSWLDPTTLAHPDSPAGGQGTGFTRASPSPLLSNGHSGPVQVDAPIRWIQGSVSAFYQSQEDLRKLFALDIQQFENRCAKASDELRNLLPEGPLRWYYDSQVGSFKGVHGFVEALLSGAVDVGTFFSKLMNPIFWFDPDLHRQLQTMAQYAFVVGRADYIIKYGTWEQKRELLIQMENLVTQAYQAVSKSIQKDWDKAIAEGKEAELISKWSTRLVLEVGSFFIGVGEVKAAVTASRAARAAELSRGLKTADMAGDALRVEKEASRVYRVQGGELPKASKTRIGIGEKGEMTVEGSDMLHVTIDDAGRARAYRAENRPGGEIISFEVDPAFSNEVRAAAKRQAQAREFPSAPQVDDPTKTSNSFGLPEEWIEKLKQAAKPGTGRTE